VIGIALKTGEREREREREREILYRDDFGGKI
jgi:hypothetical protein